MDFFHSVWEGGLDDVDAVCGDDGREGFCVDDVVGVMLARPDVLFSCRDHDVVEIAVFDPGLADAAAGDVGGF